MLFSSAPYCKFSLRVVSDSDPRVASSPLISSAVSVMMLITATNAFAPYKAEPGPLTTSICLTSSIEKSL